VRKRTSKELLFIGCLVLVSLYLIWAGVKEYLWRLKTTVSTNHCIIYFSAAAEQTESVGARVEPLYSSYAGLLKDITLQWDEDCKLGMKLFENRDGFRFCSSSVHFLNWKGVALFDSQ
jgi:hypothetical protein